MSGSRKPRARGRPWQRREQQEAHYQTNCSRNMRRWPGKFQSFFHQTRQRFSHAAAANYLITCRYTGNGDARIREAGRVTEIFSWSGTRLADHRGFLVVSASLLCTLINASSAEADPASHSALTRIGLLRASFDRFRDFLLIDDASVYSTLLAESRKPPGLSRRLHELERSRNVFVNGSRAFRAQSSGVSFTGRGLECRQLVPAV